MAASLDFTYPKAASVVKCHPKRYHWKCTSATSFKAWRMKKYEKGTFLQSSPASKTGDKVSWFSHQSLMRKGEREAWTNPTADVKNPCSKTVNSKSPSPKITKTLEHDLSTQRTDSICSRGANMVWKPPSGNLRNWRVQNHVRLSLRTVVQICANP